MATGSGPAFVSSAQRARRCPRRQPNEGGPPGSLVVTAIAGLRQQRRHDVVWDETSGHI
jgi:hypothetical protein